MSGPQTNNIRMAGSSHSLPGFLFWLSWEDWRGTGGQSDIGFRRLVTHAIGCPAVP